MLIKIFKTIAQMIRHWKPKKSGFSVSVSVLKPIIKPIPKNTKKPKFKTETKTENTKKPIFVTETETEKPLFFGFQCLQMI